MAARPETHMSASSSSSSSSESYEVFLNFRGEDTRGNFTDHLYHALERAGIRTFRDNEELQKGKEIGQGLMNAIIESKISIPVFSEKYASSKWCLKELAQIMKCMENEGQIVLPVFYIVNPSDIRHQTGSFAEAFLEHEKTQPKGCVDSWRKALEQAGSLKGWHYEKREQSEADTIDSIVKEVLNELKKTTPLHVGNHLIGIDSRVDDVIRLLDLKSQELDLKSHDVQYMAICGMGGIGKTTIAMAVFNKICCHFTGDSKGLSFLVDVSSTSQQVDGLVKLQNKLLSDILGNNQGLDDRLKGITKIKERCCNKKVLIILDDVDHDDQLEALADQPNWFGSGSRIIITTREKNILRVKQVETKIYEPEVLNDNQSLQLFSNHAFGKNQPPKTFMLLSRNIVEIVGRLPLAIKVLGSFLNGVSCDVWESTVDNLKKIPNDDIKKKLQISYDRLNALEKDIFLDIACFFIGMDKEIVIHILEDFFPKKNIYVLIHKFLVSIDDNNKLRMHDLLRDMGREIVRQESPKKAGKRTRLWSRGDALDVLKKGKGTSSIEGLSLVCRQFDPENYRCLKIEAFKPMSDLRLLQVDVAYMKMTKKGHRSFSCGLPTVGTPSWGNFDALSTELKWLSWKRSPSEWIPSISHLRKLSVLDLSNSLITDDWNGWQHIQKVKTLKVLDLGGCCHLTRTPDFSHNTRLQRLILDGCWSLVACDESIGCLQKLVYLTLKSCSSIKNLPDSICKLSSLTTLILSNCHDLEKLPEALGDMKSLTELMIDGTGIEELPDSIGSLEELVRLSAKDCRMLARLPHSMGKLRRLQYINLLESRIIELPKGFGNLCSLKELKMCEPSNCYSSCIAVLKGREELMSIPILRVIIFELNVMLCVSMESLPNLSNFKSLERLQVYHCKKLTEIEGLNGLSLLQELDLTNCKMLQSLPELPSSLITLKIRICAKLTEIKDLNGLTLLQQLVLKNCPVLQSLPELPPSLIILDIGHCISMESLPNLFDLNKLEELYLVDCEKLTEIEGLNGLTLLQQLVLQNCPMLQSLPELPPSLTRLHIEGCESMESLPNLSDLNKLEELYLDNCEKITKIEGLTGLSLLQQLDLTNCKMLQTLPELPSSLITLNIEGCYSMVSMPNLSNLNKLEVLRANGCEKLIKIEGLNGLSLLKHLDLQNWLMLQSLPELPPSLISIDISYCRSMESLPNLSNLKILEKLCLGHCGKLAKIEGMGGHSLLKYLILRNCVMLQSLPELPPSLTKLQVRGCMKLSEIEGIIGLSLLKVLHLYDCRELRSLPDLSNLKKLEELLLEGCDNLVEIRGLESLESLKYFRVLGCNTYIKTLQKCVAQGMLVGAFHGENIQKSYQIAENDENIKGMALLLVYQTLLEELLGKPIHLKIEAVIMRNDGEWIRCCHDLQIEGMTGTDVDGYYSCYFHGLTWFGLPLRKQYIIQVIVLSCLPEEPYRIQKFFRSHQEANKVRIKMFVIVPEYETREDSQQLEKQIAPLITCTSVESKGVGRDKKHDDDARS